ncbi:hypothetical protein CR513_18096, partial [Mucuna pruriens]
YFLALKHKPFYLLLPKVGDRVSLTPSRLNHFWLKPYRFPISRDRITESKSLLMSSRPSRHFPSRRQAKARSVSTHNAIPTQEEYVSDKQVPSQPRSALEPKSLQQWRKLNCITHFTLLTLSFHSSVVHGASVQHLVDRGGVDLEFGKPEVIRGDRLPPRRKYVIKLAPLSGSESQELGSMENNDRTLKELAMPDVVYQPLCIQYLQLEPTQSYELNYSLIHLLPKFHGFAGEDPHKHLKEFHVVCSMMRPQGIPEDYIKMKTFPFSLDEATKDWLYLHPVLFNTWGI